MKATIKWLLSCVMQKSTNKMALSVAFTPAVAVFQQEKQTLQNKATHFYYSSYK